MASHPPRKSSEAERKASDNRALMTAAAVLTFVAGSGGWFLGTNISGIIVPLQQTQPADEGNRIGADVIEDNSNVIVLPPVLTNLASPATAWIRMQISLVARPKEKITSDMAAEISNDFLAYLRQSSLARIKGPTGFMYLREDLLDRASTRSGGKISHILISGLVIEE